MDNKKAICGSTDTGFLKLIAFLTMFIDHVGYIFFPKAAIFRIIGRIAFPLFAYCLVVGFDYTRSVKKYALRLLAFSLISQPVYTLAFYEKNMTKLFDPEYYSNFRVALFNIANNFGLNIGFTLLLGLWAIYGLRAQKYHFTVFALILSCFPIFEYSVYGVLIIVFMYAFSKSSRADLGIVIAVFLLLPFWVGKGFYNFFGFNIDPQGFAVLALPLILAKTHTNIKIPRLINYGFYSAHLVVLYIIKSLV